MEEKKELIEAVAKAAIGQKEKDMQKMVKCELTLSLVK